MNHLAELYALPERRLQHIVRMLLADTDHIWQTTAGKPLQVVSPGEWNDDGGPDFRNMAVLVGGTVFVGDGEFHRRSTDWTDHGHDRDPAYARVLLHLVLEDNARRAFAEHTIVLDAGMMAALVHAVPEVAEQTGMPAEELQEYAYRRLLRKTAEALDLVRGTGAVEAFVVLARRFLDRRAQGRLRPGGKAALVSVDDAALAASAPALLCGQLAAGAPDVQWYQALSAIAKERWIRAGAAMRMELLVNAFLPVALATAKEHARTDVLTWFWSQRAVQAYGTLKRRYPAVGQEYIWKQQGLLEYAAMQKFGPDRVAETDRWREDRLREATLRTTMPKATITLTLGVQ